MKTSDIDQTKPDLFQPGHMQWGISHKLVPVSKENKIIFSNDHRFGSVKSGSSRAEVSAYGHSVTKGNGLGIEESQPVFRPGLNRLLTQLLSLMNDGDYDEEFLRPTAYALSTARQLVINSSLTSGNSLPSADIYPDGDGGIRIEWKRERRYVRLIVSAKPETGYYLYEQDGKKFQGENNISASELGSRLSWLTDENLSSSALLLYCSPSNTQKDVHKSGNGHSSARGIFAPSASPPN